MRNEGSDLFTIKIPFKLIVMEEKKKQQRGEFSNKLEKHLKSENLAAVFAYAKDDKELDIQFRSNYINIYYKGGNILKISPKKTVINLEFDKFYFYLDAKNGKENLWTRKTNIKKALKGDNLYKAQLNKNKAKEIIDKLNREKNELIARLEKEGPAAYFSNAKHVMDEWFKHMKEEGIFRRNEKETQQKISLVNKSFKDSDIIVLDVEYAVSQKSSYGKKGTTPRADMIGLDKTGRIHIMELKYGIRSIKGSAGIVKHLEDFEQTIQKDSKGEFKSEMKWLLEQKKRYGLIEEKEAFISEEKAPVFDLVFCNLDADERKSMGEEYRKYEGRINHIFYLQDDSLYLKG